MVAEDDFADLLRRFRARLSPAAAGIRIPEHSRRRARGLRREELAERAGVSIDHVKRLEQRRRQPSPGVVDSLARALLLGPDDHGRLRSAAGYAEPRAAARRVPREITPAARRVMERLSDVPVAVCDATWTVLAGNDMWASGVCASEGSSERDRNMAWRVFTGAPTTVFRSARSMAAFRASLVADLRAASRRYDDPRLVALVDDLIAASAEFARLWQNADRARYEVDRLHAWVRDGGAVLERDTLIVDGDLRVAVFTRPTDRPADAGVA